MPFKFNPFTGNFDQTGSGGGGASYIDGEVATYADLPLDGTAPLNSAWLVRTASGVWPVSRKQAGIYIRTATGGSSRDADYTYAGTMPDVFSDAQFLLYDNTDTSKNLAFDLGGINTETTRTLTVPDKSGKIVLQNTSTGTIEPTPIVSSAQRMGSIDLGGDAFGDYRGGLIVMRGDGADGGTLNLSDGGGSVNTSLYGGSILTYGVDAATFLSGGSIITYGGGGDINTRGTGSIGFGSSGTRTTVTGTATANRAISLPNAGGTIALTSDFAAPPAIGNTTPAAGSFTTLSATGDGTINGFVIGATSIAPTSGSRNYQTNTGEGLVAVTSGAALAAGTNAARFAAFSNNRCGMRPEGELGWASSGAPSSSNFDVILRRDAAGVLAQYNGTNPQTFRLYNTFTDASNHERGFMRWSSNALQIGTEAAGTGTTRNLELYGASVTVFSDLTIPAANRFRFGSGGTRIIGASNGILRICNGAENDFNRLQFGGTDANFPALKRSSTALQVRLADDSADAPLSSASLTSGDGTRTSLAYLFASDTDTGFYRRGTDTITFVAGGSNRFEVSGSQARLEVNQLFGWTFNDMSGSLDLVLRRDAADTLAQRRDGNAQNFRIYNTSTSSNANFERANFRWASNEFIIDAEAGGTGTLRGIKIGSATSSLLGFYGATPVDRPATVADPTGGGTIDAEARTAINAIIDRLQELGLIA